MSDKRIIYLDNSATTKICDEALNKYVELSRESFGNPSSLHSMGLAAEKELDRAREAVLASVGERDARVIFTASGTEANNLAIFGRAFAKDRFKHGSKIITTEGEHASVASPFDELIGLGYTVAKIPTVNGVLDLEALSRELTQNVILVSMMMVNNETGALYDIKSAAEIIRKKAPDALIHVDATQSYMKVRFTKRSLGADMITLSSHKIEGPKGVGALVVDNKIIKSRGIVPTVLGGGQEGGYRSGTENVPAIAAFGEAVRLGFKSIDSRIEKLSSLRSYLIERLSTDSRLSEIKITNPENHAPHILNITLPKIKSETALHFLSSLGIYVSSGSACSSNSAHTSSALTAYGKSAEEADSSIRISFSHRNEKEDVDALCEGLFAVLERLKRIR